MNKKSKILLVGLQSSSVDFEKWPQLSVEKLEKAFSDIIAELTQHGYSAVWCLTDTGETAEQKLTESIEAVDPDLVIVGAGVRTDPDHFLLFEKIINIIHKKAPNAHIAFNTNPYDTIEAINRWS
ncbi:MAG: universal stress protein [Desulfocapsaceae bacterium]|nr:universal stress protein [Desulfocapsaceae bacterium]